MDIETGFADLIFDSLGERRSRIKTRPRVMVSMDTGMSTAYTHNNI
jgi:hypothetical protein